MPKETQIEEACPLKLAQLEAVQSAHDVGDEEFHLKQILENLKLKSNPMLKKNPEMLLDSERLRLNCFTGATNTRLQVILE